MGQFMKQFDFHVSIKGPLISQFLKKILHGSKHGLFVGQFMKKLNFFRHKHNNFMGQYMKQVLYA